MAMLLLSETRPSELRCLLAGGRSARRQVSPWRPGRRHQPRPRKPSGLRSSARCRPGRARGPRTCWCGSRPALVTSPHAPPQRRARPSGPSSATTSRASSFRTIGRRAACGARAPRSYPSVGRRSNWSTRASRTSPSMWARSSGACAATHRRTGRRARPLASTTRRTYGGSSPCFAHATARSPTR